MGFLEPKHVGALTNEIWKVLANVTDDEIKECKRRALLANSPTKCILSKSWGMHMFSTGKYLCEELAIILSSQTLRPD